MNGTRREVHRHLADGHGDKVSVRVDEERNRRFYEIRCPECDAPWEREIKPRYRDAGFIKEFDEEIKLVAFDMLLYHMQGEHWMDAEGAAGGEGESTG